LWKQAVEQAGSADDIEAVRTAAVGQTLQAPEGLVTLQKNHHLSKTVRIGEIGDDGMFKIVSESPAPVDPIPWNQYVAETKGYSCDWEDPTKGGKYRI
jgi:urea transport system substrate-binding protein